MLGPSIRRSARAAVAESCPSITARPPEAVDRVLGQQAEETPGNQTPRDDDPRIHEADREPQDGEPVERPTSVPFPRIIDGDGDGGTSLA